MAERSKQNKATDSSAREVQKAVDAETEQGYRGAKADPLPNSAYSLESGPAAPVVDSTGRLGQLDVADLGG